MAKDHGHTCLKCPSRWRCSREVYLSPGGQNQCQRYKQSLCDRCFSDVAEERAEYGGCGKEPKGRPRDYGKV